jgi:ribosomal protein S18 acetylase RimI-like enzyme
MWRDNGVEDDDLEAGWQQRFDDFLHQAQTTLGSKSFIASVGGSVVASASCQRLVSPYPRITRREFGRRGYIWGVYVEPEHRRMGVGRELTERCIAHLTVLGCDEAVLHSSPFGRSIYEKLGFTAGSEMVKSLIPLG